MSLQGSIETFAVADVLRLLAATAKTGRLHVQGPTRAGTVFVESSRIVAAESPSTPDEHLDMNAPLPDDTRPLLYDERPLPVIGALAFGAAALLALASLVLSIG